MAFEKRPWVLTNGGGSLFLRSNCLDQTVIPKQRGINVRRSSQFKSFDGQSWTDSSGTNPIPLTSVVNTTSPAKFARLLIIAYRNRHIKLPPINTVNRNPRIFLNLCCRNQIIVEERALTPSGVRPTTKGETTCIIRTIFQNNCCSIAQLEEALRDICRVEHAIESGATPFAGISSGCPDCPGPDMPDTQTCINCQVQDSCPRQNRYIPAGPRTSLTEDDIQRIIRWYETGVEYEPPSE